MMHYAVPSPAVVDTVVWRIGPILSEIGRMRLRILHVADRCVGLSQMVKLIYGWTRDQQDRCLKGVCAGKQEFRRHLGRRGIETPFRQRTAIGADHLPFAGGTARCNHTGVFW